MQKPLNMVKYHPFGKICHTHVNFYHKIGNEILDFGLQKMEKLFLPIFEIVLGGLKGVVNSI